MSVTYAQLIEALKPVEDPDLGLSIIALGLVRGVDIAEGDGGASVTIELTLTTPMCPFGPELMEAVKQAASQVQGVVDVQLNMVWDPPWDPRLDSDDEVKAMLGIWD